MSDTVFTFTLGVTALLYTGLAFTFVEFGRLQAAKVRARRR